MATKLRKMKSAGRFGPRYGKRPKDRLIKVESLQRVKQKCPYCSKERLKRMSKGIWQCTRKKCDKRFASDVYYIS